MKRGGPKNIVASVQARLVERSRELGVEHQLTLARFGGERLLYRMSQSEFADRFILKGAALLLLWLGEPAPNLDPRRHRAVISCLSSNLRVSFVLFVLSLSIAVARDWPSRREIVRRSSAPSSHFALLRPLRAGGLDSASAAPAIGQLSDGHRSIANVLSA